jgi:hypothetical protein
MQGREDQVTGERCLDGDGRGLQVTNFPQHDDVGRLTQHGAQGGGEGHAHILFHHDLIDSGQLVFHRIFHRDDLAVRSVDEVEAGVERGGLAGTGRARHQNDAVRQGDELLKGWPGRH